MGLAEVGSAVVGDVGVEEVNVVGGDGGVEGVIVDEVFESVEMVVSGEGGEGNMSGGAEALDNVSGGGGAMGAEEPKGEKEKGASLTGDEGVNAVNIGGDVEGSPGGAEEGDSASVGGGEDDVGGDSAGGGIEVDGGEDTSGISVNPIPLIPRWRLREILAHAEGECIMLLC